MAFVFAVAVLHHQYLAQRAPSQCISKKNENDEAKNEEQKQKKMKHTNTILWNTEFRMVFVRAFELFCNPSICFAGSFILCQNAVCSEKPQCMRIAERRRKKSSAVLMPLPQWKRVRKEMKMRMCIDELMMVACAEWRDHICSHADVWLPPASIAGIQKKCLRTFLKNGILRPSTNPHVEFMHATSQIYTSDDENSFLGTKSKWLEWKLGERCNQKNPLRFNLHRWWNFGTST